MTEKERELNKTVEAKVDGLTARLAMEKSRLDKIYQHIEEALFVLDLKGLIASVNPAACRMLDCDAESLIGMRMGDIFEEEDIRQAEAFYGTWLEALIMAGALEQIDACFVAQDGSRIPILFSRTALCNDQDEVCGIICVAKDMS